MLDLKSFSQAIQQSADEKGISKDKIFETIEMALAAAYKRDYRRRGQIVRAQMDPASGKIEMGQIKIVVVESMVKAEEEIGAEEEERSRRLAEAIAGGVSEREAKKKEREAIEAEEESIDVAVEKKVRFNPEKHLMLEEARGSKPDTKPGDELEFLL